MCPPFIHHHNKITSHTKRERTQFEDTEQTLEPESDMVGMLELSDQELKTKNKNKTIIIHILRALMQKIDDK